MTDQHQRCLLAGGGQGGVEVRHDTLRRERGGRIAPHDPGAGVGAGSRRPGDGVVNRRPAEGSAGIESVDQHDGGRATAPAVEVDPPASDVHQLARRWKPARGRPLGHLLPDGADDDQDREKRQQPEADAFEQAFHGRLAIGSSIRDRWVPPKRTSMVGTTVSAASGRFDGANEGWSSKLGQSALAIASRIE